MCGKLPGTLALFAVMGLVRFFYRPFYPDVTHVGENTRPSPAFPYCKLRKAGWGLGTRLDRKGLIIPGPTFKGAFEFHMYN